MKLYMNAHTRGVTNGGMNICYDVRGQKYKRNFRATSDKGACASVTKGTSWARFASQTLYDLENVCFLKKQAAQ